MVDIYIPIQIYKKHIHTLRKTHTHTQIYTYTGTHTHIHTHTGAYTHTHIHKHIHTHHQTIVLNKAYLYSHSVGSLSVYFRGIIASYA